MHTVLIVDDEADMLELVEYTLSKAGFDTIGCLNTQTVEQILEEEPIDLIIMDRNLPGVEGSIFVQHLRSVGYQQPVIYLSAKDSDDDMLEGFERGGDDYITKPFNLNLLIARVKALIKRSKGEAEVIAYRDISYHFESKRLLIEQEEIILSTLERNLMVEFLRNPNILLDRDTLLERIWKDNEQTKYKTVNVAIKRLKGKIDPMDKKKYIRAIRGEGYILC